MSFLKIPVIPARFPSEKPSERVGTAPFVINFHFFNRSIKKLQSGADFLFLGRGCTSNPKGLE